MGLAREWTFFQGREPHETMSKKQKFLDFVQDNKEIIKEPLFKNWGKQFYTE